MIFLSEPITSKDNPSIKLFRKLMTSKKERSEKRAFVLEGSRLVFDALKSGAPISRILIAAHAAEKFGSRLDEYSRIGMDIISDQLADKISDTGSTQGIFAQCSFLDGTDSLGQLKKHGRYAVLSRLQDPGNAGMIIRTADAMGLDGVIFSESCDIYNPKTVRSTMGSLFRIPVYRDIAEDDIFLALDKADIPSFAAVVDSDADDLRTVDFSGGGAIFTGNEGNGLSPETVSKCSRRITIKMKGNTESLNAAMAAGIIMWELAK
ncbi:MAG: TrmH family RNA methyltransferase [Porcipelethomonas sp.]